VIQSYKADDLNLNMPDFQIKASDLELKLYQTTYVKEENVFRKAFYRKVFAYFLSSKFIYFNTFVLGRPLLYC